MKTDKNAFAKYFNDCKNSAAYSPSANLILHCHQFHQLHELKIRVISSNEEHEGISAESG